MVSHYICIICVYTYDYIQYVVCLFLLCITTEIMLLGQPESYIPVTINQYAVDFRIGGQAPVLYDDEEVVECSVDSDCGDGFHCQLVNDTSEMCFYSRFIEGSTDQLHYTLNVVIMFIDVHLYII